VDRLPLRDGAPPHRVQAGQGQRPHPHPGRPRDRPAEHRQGDRHHPQFGRAEGGADRRFRLSDRQAEDILEIRLRQLARLEAIKIQQELAELRGEKEKLEDILDNPSTR
jgi:DNA gyrase/topoisomerase IV subunit A